MTASAEQMRSDLLALPASEAEEQAFEKELDRRTQEFRRDEAIGTSPEEMFAALAAMLVARRR